ncbi:MAG: hypothetical protein ACR2LY_03330 [Thermoleophilaceae bacterium]
MSDSAGPDPAAFSSGESGHVAGVRRVVGRRAADLALDAGERLRGTGRRLDRLAAAGPRRSVLALSIYRPGETLLAAAAVELQRSRHDVRLAFGSTGGSHAALAPHTVVTDLAGGKFPNLNRVLGRLEDGAAGAVDWVLVVDDDVVLPHGFVDRFLALCEAFALDLAQPAQTLRSHAAWRVTRRRPASLLRRTRFVEIGPVTAFGSRAAAELLPFPEMRYGWGLDLHWAALAEARGWRLGVVDATAVRHEQSPVAGAYGHDDAIAETRAFLRDRPFVSSGRAQATLSAHRRLPLAARRRVAR